MPFKEELNEYKDLANTKYHFLDKVDERVHQLEDYAQIEVSETVREQDARLKEGEIGPQPKPRKQNKFDILSDRIHDN